MPEPIIIESLRLVTLLLYAIDRVKIQPIFDRDPYESRRQELKGLRLVKVVVFYQLIKDPTQRGLLRALDRLQDVQAALGGTLKRNTLSNALVQRDLGQIIEAWIMLLAHYRPYLEQRGKKFARIAAVDASLIKLSLAAYDWAKYRKKTGAAKIPCVFDWVKGVPQQFVFTGSGKLHDLKASTEIAWCAGWTYVFDRGYFAFDLLTASIPERISYCDSKTALTSRSSSAASSQNSSPPQAFAPSPVTGPSSCRVGMVTSSCVWSVTDSRMVS
jgi:hypothetical protein